MTQSSVEGWLPDDIQGVIAELIANRESIYWVHVDATVRWFARTYGQRYSTYLDEADDIANDTLLILATPGVLASFGRPKSPKGDAPQANQPEQPEQLVQHDQPSPSSDSAMPATPTPAAFLAFLATITRRVWISRLRYYHVRITADTLEAETDDDLPPQLLDPRGDIVELLHQQHLLQAAYERLQTLREQDPTSALRVILFLLGALYGIPYRQIAERFGCSEQQVRQAVYKIRQQLHDLWVQAQTDAPPPFTPTAPHPSSAKRKPPSQRLQKPLDASAKAHRIIKHNRQRRQGEDHHDEATQ